MIKYISIDSGSYLEENIIVISDVIILLVVYMSTFHLSILSIFVSNNTYQNIIDKKYGGKELKAE